MITRVYKCKKCGKDFEEKVSIKDEPRKHCECGAELSQFYGNPDVLWFNDPRNGAISNRWKANRHG